MADGKQKVGASRSADRSLGKQQIADFFEKLKLGSAAERQKYLWLERLSKPDPEHETPNEGFRVIFGDSSAEEPASH